MRDRDAIVTIEGLIFRVLGYTHPADAYFCDLEYAPSNVFQSANPKAPRGTAQTEYYKLYEDEGWKFLLKNFPQHLILHEMLGRKTIGVTNSHIKQTRKPNQKLEELLKAVPKDSLIKAMQDVLQTVAQHSGLTVKNFGVFGSLLHGFHHARLSDIDLIICGRKEATKLVKTLEEIYEAKSSTLSNEFQFAKPVQTKQWRFMNLTPDEYLWHQKRKAIYAVFDEPQTGRKIKTEFEPVKDWIEIKNAYNATARIIQEGWVEMSARVIENEDALFMPSMYAIEPLDVTKGAKEAYETIRIISYMEEFRMQAHKDEIIQVAGNLEHIDQPNTNFHQITLTYCPRYYEQTLKTLNMD